MNTAQSSERLKRVSSRLALLPEELVELIADHLQEPLWPPVDSVITDWNSYPSAGSQRDLCALSLTCRTLHRIVAPRLSKHILHDFRDKPSNGTTPRLEQDRYQWLSSKNFPSNLHPLWIRVLYLDDFFRDLDPALEARKMGEALERLSGLEVLVTKGFSASVLLHTLSELSLKEMNSLKVLKVYSYTVTVQGMLAAFRVFPNLIGITIDAVNIQGIDAASAHSLAPKSTRISQLDLCTRLFAPEEYEALGQILMPLVSTLKMVHIHGEYAEELCPVASILKQSQIETLLLHFRNKFPDGLMTLRLESLKTLSISTYAFTSSNFWQSNILQTVSHLIIRSSGHPLDIRQLNRSIKVPNLKILQLQSLCKRCEKDVQNWHAEMLTWCLKRDVLFKNNNSDTNILKPQDDYWFT